MCCSNERFKFISVSLTSVIKLLVLLVIPKPNLVFLCICVDYKSMVKIKGELKHIIGFGWGIGANLYLDTRVYEHYQNNLIPI